MDRLCHCWPTRLIIVLLAGAVTGIKGDDVGSVLPSSRRLAAPLFLLIAPLGKKATLWQGAHLS